MPRKHVFENRHYAPLHCHTDKSRFDGLAKPDKSVMRAREMGFPAMGCTDHGTVAAWIKFVAECTRKKDKKGNDIPFAPIKPALGCEFYLARNHKYANILDQPDGRAGNRHLIAFAKNWNGFQNLCRLSESSWCEGFYHSPRVDIEQLATHSEGLIISSACLSSVINASLLNDRYDAALRAVGLFKDIFKEDFFLEVMYHGIDAEAAIIPDIFKLAAATGTPVIATNDCFPEGTFISTDRGVRPIESLVVGDMVLTHNGRYRPVEHSNVRTVTETVVVKCALGTEAFETTPEHPVRCVRRLGKGWTPPEWVPAGSLTPSHYMLLASQDDSGFSTAGIGSIDVRKLIGHDFDHCLQGGEYVTRRSFGGRAGEVRVSAQLPVDDDLLFVLGRFVAEGSVDKQGSAITFSAHVKEKDVQDRIERYFARFGCTAYRPLKGQDGKLVFSSVIWKEILRLMCGEGAANKRLPVVPDGCYLDWSASQMRKIIAAYIGGDGHLPTSEGRSALACASTSRQLAFEVADSLHRFGITAVPSRRNRFARHKNTRADASRWNPLYVVHVSQADRTKLYAICSLTCTHADNPPRIERRKAIDLGGVFAVKVKSLTRRRSEVKVYNLQVAEDESFSANFWQVHNCHYVTKDMAKSQEALMCMSTSKCILDKKHLHFPYDEFYLKSAAEMAIMFGDRPEVLYNTIALTERIDDKDIATNMGGMRLPTYKVPAPFTSPHEYLEHLAWEGMKKLGWQNSTPHVACLKKELGDVRVAQENNGYDFATYFLVVWDYINAARKKKILTGCGRGCLSPEVPVQTTRGFVPISEIKEGDRVLTATGESRLVLTTHEYDVSSERMVKLHSCHGDFGGLTLTHDHKVSVERQRETAQYLTVDDSAKGKVRRYCRPEGKREWVPASAVNVGDWMFVPWAVEPRVYEVPSLDLSRYADGRRLVTCGEHVEERWMIGRTSICRAVRRLPRTLTADERFAWIIGKFVADGWIRTGPSRRNAVYFCANTSELHQLEYIKGYFREHGITDFRETRQVGKNVVQLAVKSVALYELFANMFCDYRQTSNTKHLPSWFRSISRSMRVAMVQGLFAGDGHCGKCERKATYTTTSRRLAFEVKELLHLLKCPAGVHRERGDRRNNFSVMALKHPAVCSGKLGFDATAVYVSLDNPHLKNTFLAEDGFYTKVRSKEEYIASGKVYDLTVDAESNYVSSNGLVHNSGYASILLRTLGITYGPDPLKYNLLWERFLGFDERRFYLASDFGLQEEEVDIAAIADRLAEEADEEADLHEMRDVEDDPGGVDRY